MMEMVVLLILVGYASIGLIFGAITSSLAHRKGYKGYLWVGFWGLILGVIYVAELPDSEEKTLRDHQLLALLTARANSLNEDEIRNEYREIWTNWNNGMRSTYVFNSVVRTQGKTPKAKAVDNTNVQIDDEAFLLSLEEHPNPNPPSAAEGEMTHCPDCGNSCTIDFAKTRKKCNACGRPFTF